jgi:hypothetical protein
VKKVVLLLACLVVVSTAVLGAKSLTGDRVLVREPLSDNLMIFGGELSVTGDVDGDIICAGGSVAVESDVKGDVVCAGGSISVDRVIDGDVRIAGGNVEVSARINGDLVVAGGNVQIRDSAVVGKDLVVKGGNVLFLGSVGRNMDVQGGSVSFAGIVGNDVFIDADSVSFEEGSRVGGNLTYRSSEEADTSKVSVGGAIFKKVVPVRPAGQIARAFFVAKLIGFLSLLVIGLLAILSMPKGTATIAKTFGTKFWRSLGLGLLVAVLTPIVAIILLVTIVGIPLALILLVLYAILLYIARLVAAFWLAELFGYGKIRLWGFIISLLVVYIVISIPVIGWLISLIITLTGVGAIVFPVVKLGKKKL